MSPAEQEWGRALRRVPGPPPSPFPELAHPNWAVVVTHAALGLRELFEKFLQGMTADVVRDAVANRMRPALASAYEAGETVLRLSDTATLKSGDVLELRVPVALNESSPPKFNLLKELQRTGSLFEENNPVIQVSTNGTNGDRQINAPHTLNSPHSAAQEQPAVLPWQQEVDAIGERLAQIRSVKTFQVQIEAVLDGNAVQITPTWFDFPAGAEVSKSRPRLNQRQTDFLQHVGLDWQVLVDGELISYQTYQRRVVLQKHGLNLDQEGEIIAGSIRLKDTMPPAAFELFLKGVEAELAQTVVDIPHSDAIARPDKAKLEMQERYGARVRGMVNDLFKQRGLIPEGLNGKSLVEKPVELLAQAIERVRARGEEPSFRSNSELVHAAVFGFVKDKTGRSWSEHQDEGQYQEACRLAHQYLLRLREQLQWRSWR